MSLQKAEEYWNNRNSLIGDDTHIDNVIEIAAKPEWFHPSEGQFPEIGEYVIAFNDYLEESYDIVKYEGRNDWILKNGDWFDDLTVIAWTKIPKYNKNGNNNKS